MSAFETAIWNFINLQASDEERTLIETARAKNESAVRDMVLRASMLPRPYAGDKILKNGELAYVVIRTEPIKGEPWPIGMSPMWHAVVKTPEGEMTYANKLFLERVSDGVWQLAN